MTTLTKPQHRLITIASVLGILQGIAWIVMAIICIVEYLDSKNSGYPNLDPNASYMEYFNFLLFTTFLYGNSSSDYIINPDAFMVFMWVYLIADIIWLILSILQLRSINQRHSNSLNLLKCWGVITFLIACIDFLLVILLGADHNDCISRPLVDDSLCTNVFLPVLVIAAKGFILWIVNVSFVYVIYRIIRTIQSGKNLHKNLLGVDPQIPRATLQSSTNNWPNQPNLSNQNNYSSHPVSSNNNNNFWDNNPRPVSYGGRTPPTSPAYYSAQQQKRFPAY